MPGPLRRIVVLATGWSFILLGVVGLFLPILQGVLFLLVGLWILSTESAAAAGLLSRLRRRYPKMSETVEAARNIAARKLRRLGEIFRK